MGEHRLTVEAWCARVTGSSVEALIQAFERMFTALWERSYLTLGEVTLLAIVDRVAQTATEQFPILGPVEIGPSGLRFENLHSQRGLRRDEVSTAIRYVLVEFLTVLGKLTAEILTPALHAELSRDHAVAADRGATEDPAS